MTYPADPGTFSELLRLAEDVIDRRSRNFVNDAMLLARWVRRDGKQAVDERAQLIGLIEELGEAPDPARVQALISIAKGMIR